MTDTEQLSMTDVISQQHVTARLLQTTHHQWPPCVTAKYYHSQSAR